MADINYYVPGSEDAEDVTIRAALDLPLDAARPLGGTLDFRHSISPQIFFFINKEK
jgi:hypothetical protein